MALICKSLFKSKIQQCKILFNHAYNNFSNELSYLQDWPLETKGRQFIRMALVKKSLQSPIEHLVKNRNIMQVHQYVWVYVSIICQKIITI